MATDAQSALVNAVRLPYFGRRHNRYVGDMVGEITLAIEMGADAVIGKTVNPMLGESISMAADVAHGSCMDVPLVCK